MGAGKVRHGGDLVIKSLADHKNVGLEVVAGEMVKVWLGRKANPPVLKKIAMSVKPPDPILKETLVTPTT